ncbi:hypothetical protein Tco_1202581 [Tanacetum coccineum]
MGDANPIRTLGDYSKPSHEGYRNTIELPVGNNVLVQNGCSFYGIGSEDPNQHLKDFLKLVDSLDLDGANKERTRLRPNPQPQALGTTFEARVQDYMAAHTERMERFKNAIFKLREELNDRMTEMFRLLKELTTSRAPEKTRKKKNDIYDVATIDGIKENSMVVSVKEAETQNGAENRAKNMPIKKAEKEEEVVAPSSQPVEYRLKHKISEKLIE